MSDGGTGAARDDGHGVEIARAGRCPAPRAICIRAAKERGSARRRPRCSRRRSLRCHPHIAEAKATVIAVPDSSRASPRGSFRGTGDAVWRDIDMIVQKRLAGGHTECVHAAKTDLPIAEPILQRARRGGQLRQESSSIRRARSSLRPEAGMRSIGRTPRMLEALRRRDIKTYEIISTSSDPDLVRRGGRVEVEKAVMNEGCARAFHVRQRSRVRCLSSASRSSAQRRTSARCTLRSMTRGRLLPKSALLSRTIRGKRLEDGSPLEEATPDAIAAGDIDPRSSRSHLSVAQSFVRTPSEAAHGGRGKSAAYGRARHPARSARA